jgi:hypothetical protein
VDSGENPTDQFGKIAGSDVSTVLIRRREEEEEEEEGGGSRLFLLSRSSIQL